MKNIPPIGIYTSHSNPTLQPADGSRQEQRSSSFVTCGLPNQDTNIDLPPYFFTPHHIIRNSSNTSTSAYVNSEGEAFQQRSSLSAHGTTKAVSRRDLPSYHSTTYQNNQVRVPFGRSSSAFANLLPKSREPFQPSSTLNSTNAASTTDPAPCFLRGPNTSSQISRSANVNSESFSHHGSMEEGQRQILVGLLLKRTADKLISTQISRSANVNSESFPHHGTMEEGQRKHLVDLQNKGAADNTKHRRGMQQMSSHSTNDGGFTGSQNSSDHMAGTSAHQMNPSHHFHSTPETAASPQISQPGTAQQLVHGAVSTNWWPQAQTHQDQLPGIQIVNSQSKQNQMPMLHSAAVQPEQISVRKQVVVQSQTHQISLKQRLLPQPQQNWAPVQGRTVANPQQNHRLVQQPPGVPVQQNQVLMQQFTVVQQQRGQMPMQQGPDEMLMQQRAFAQLQQDQMPVQQRTAAQPQQTQRQEATVQQQIVPQYGQTQLPAKQRVAAHFSQHRAPVQQQQATQPHQNTVSMQQWATTQLPQNPASVQNENGTASNISNVTHRPLGYQRRAASSIPHHMQANTKTVSQPNHCYVQRSISEPEQVIGCSSSSTLSTQSHSYTSQKLSSHTGLSESLNSPTWRQQTLAHLFNLQPPRPHFDASVSLQQNMPLGSIMYTAQAGTSSLQIPPVTVIGQGGHMSEGTGMRLPIVVSKATKPNPSPPTALEQQVGQKVNPAKNNVTSEPARTIPSHISSITTGAENLAVNFLLEDMNGVHSRHSSSQNINGVHSHDSSSESTNGVHSHDCSSENLNGVHSHNSSSENINGIHAHNSFSESTNGVHSHDCSSENLNGVHSHNSSSENINNVHSHSVTFDSISASHNTETGSVNLSFFTDLGPDSASLQHRQPDCSPSMAEPQQQEHIAQDLPNFLGVKSEQDLAINDEKSKLEDSHSIPALDFIYKCSDSYCAGVSITSQIVFLGHLIQCHSNHDRMSCPYCFEMQGTRHLIAHMTAAHQSGSSIKFACGGMNNGWHCTFKADELDMLEWHMNVNHVSEDTFMCAVCGKFTSAIKDHIRHLKNDAHNAVAVDNPTAGVDIDRPACASQKFSVRLQIVSADDNSIQQIQKLEDLHDDRRTKPSLEKPVAVQLDSIQRPPQQPSLTVPQGYGIQEELQKCTVSREDIGDMLISHTSRRPSSLPNSGIQANGSTAGNKFSCYYCNHKAPSVHTITRHCIRGHADEEVLWIDDASGLTFAAKGALVEGDYSNLQGIKFLCSKCAFRSKRRLDVIKHIANSHQKTKLRRAWVIKLTANKNASPYEYGLSTKGSQKGNPGRPDVMTPTWSQKDKASKDEDDNDSGDDSNWSSSRRSSESSVGDAPRARRVLLSVKSRNSELCDDHRGTSQETPVGPCMKTIFSNREIFDDEASGDEETEKERPTEELLSPIEINEDYDDMEDDTKITESTCHSVEETYSSLMYQCHECDYSVGSLFHFRLHVAQHVSDIDKLIPVVSEASHFRCGICGYFGMSQEDFERHENYHCLEKRFLCGYCSQDYDFNEGVRTHIINMHPGLPISVYDRKFLYRKMFQEAQKLIKLDPVVILDSSEVEEYMRGASH